MIQRFLLWFCVPWLLFLGYAAILWFIRNPQNLIVLVPFIVLLGFAARAEYAKVQRQSDVLRADAQALTLARKAEDASREAAAGQALPSFNPSRRTPLTSFAFRYGPAPNTLKRPARDLPPPAGDS